MSIRDKLIAAATPTPFEHEVEAWGGETVYLLPFDKKAMEEHDELTEDDNLDPLALQISTVVHRLLDEDGNQIFDEEEDRDLILSLDVAGFSECYQALAQRAFNLGKLRSQVEATKKNLDSARRKRKRRS